MEMDGVLICFFKEIDIANQGFEMENDQGLIRKFSINWDEGLLQGRGIKGFFAHYTAEYLTIELTEEKKIKVSTPISPTKEVSELKNEVHAGHVITSMTGLTSIPENWFQLYQIAKTFQVAPGRNELICLPYVREIQAFDYQIKTVQSVHPSL